METEPNTPQTLACQPQQQIAEQLPVCEIDTKERSFELVQRQAKALSSSNLIPIQFQNNVSNCMIALEMANRLRMEPFAVMQSMYVVHGSPSFNSQFLIACVNKCGRFTPLHYKMTGEKGTDTFGCICYAKDIATGEICESPEVTIGMAKRAKWYDKSGSHWQINPELMLRYRAATSFAKLYAPECTLGMQTSEEIIDISNNETNDSLNLYATE